MASQQRPARPLFRLASLARATAPTPAPAPTLAPAPTFVRAAFPQALRPPTGQPQPTEPQESTPPPPVPTTTLPPPPPAAALVPRSPILPPPSAVTRVSAAPEPTAARPTPQPAAAIAPPTVVTQEPRSRALATAGVQRSPLTRTSLPPFPAPKPESPTTTILPVTTSSVPKQASPIQSQQKVQSPQTSTTRADINESSSPKVARPLINSPSQSPKIRPTSQPPSHLTLPPAQMRSDTDHESKMPTEPEQKTVLLQEIVEKPWRKHDDNGRENDQKRYVTTDKGFSQKKPSTSNSEEFGMRVITIAGENKGAIMELSAARNKNRHVFGNNAQTVGKKSGSDEERKSKMRDRNQKAAMAMGMQSQPVESFMNSNVQGVNNSIVFNCSYTDNNPGVHLSLSRKANGLDYGISHKEKC